MAQKRRGRPPGSKKKPDPVVAVRIPEQALGLLKQAASSNKRKLSGEILARLDYTLGRYRKGGLDLPSHLRPLVDAFAFSARVIETQFESRWHENRFTGRELARVIGHVMVEFSPDAEDVVPPKVLERAKTHIAGEPTYLAHPGDEEAKGIIAMLRLASDQPWGTRDLEWEAELWKIRRDLERLERRRKK